MTNCCVMIYVSFEDYYKFWLKSIDSFCDTQTPVIIVGTRADKISENVSCKGTKSHKVFFFI